MSGKATDYFEEDTEEDELLPRPPQQVAPPYEDDFYPTPQPPQYVQPSVQLPGSAFIGPYPDVANTGVHRLQPPYLQGSVNQMQQVVIVGQQQQQQPSVVIAPPPPKSYVWHIVLSCVVFWFCGWICGAIAFALAVYARRLAESGQLAGARRLGHLSFAVSIVGMIVGVSVIVLAYLLIVNKNYQ